MRYGKFAIAAGTADAKAASVFYDDVVAIDWETDGETIPQFAVNNLLRSENAKGVFYETKFMLLLLQERWSGGDAEALHTQLFLPYWMMTRDVAETNFRELGRAVLATADLPEGKELLNSHLQSRMGSVPDLVVSRSDLEIQGGSDDSLSSVGLVLTGVPVVDTQLLSWEQICEIRNDREGHRKLRRLRRFVYENFEGKPRAFIEDSLQDAILDYEKVAKSHGAIVRDAVLSMVTTEEIMPLLLGSGLVAAFTDANLPLAAAIGAVTKMGETLVEIRRLSLARREELIHSPVRYLVDLRETVEEGNP